MKKTTFVLAVFFACLSNLIFGQSTIEGKVLSEGEPLIGATIRILNGDMATITDIDGRFKIKAPPGNYELIISYTGFSNSTFKINIPEEKDAKISIDVFKGRIDIKYIDNEDILAAKAAREMKAKVYYTLRDEKTFFYKLQYLPVRMPSDPVRKDFQNSQLFPALYKGTTVTFDQIAYQMYNCIVNESKIKAKVDYFRSGDGIAVVVFPHPVDQYGNIIDSSYTDNIPYPEKWTWSDILYRLVERRKGYSRAIIFLFSDQNPIFNQPGDIKEISDFEDILAKARNSADPITKVSVPKRNPGCTVIVYMFEHLDIDPKNPKLINTISAEEHLKATNLLLHLTKYH